MEEEEPEIIQSQSPGQGGALNREPGKCPEGGDAVTPEEEMPVENRNQVGALVRAGEAATRSLWIGLDTGVVFYGSNVIYLLSQSCWAGELRGNDSISYICPDGQGSVL